MSLDKQIEAMEEEVAVMQTSSFPDKGLITLFSSVIKSLKELQTIKQGTK